MATLGHVAVGLAAARAYRPGQPPRWPAAALWSAAALLPDADVIAFVVDIPYENQFGHRGFSHSLSVAVALGMIAGLAARWFKQPAGRTALFVSIAIGSHGLLDSMSDGGLGCALLWPFDQTRYFVPWRPILVAPIGLGMLSPYGLIVVLSEFVLFCPLLFLALRPAALRPRPIVASALTALWLAAVWLLASKDPVREATVGFIVRDSTTFSAGFSEEVFRSIQPGAPEEEVRRLLGTPHGEGWFYPSTRESSGPASATSAVLLRDCRSIRAENNAVVIARDPDACRAIGIQPGTSLEEVRRRLGDPREACWQYSWSPGLAVRMRLVCFHEGKVDDVIRGWALAE